MAEALVCPRCASPRYAEEEAGLICSECGNHFVLEMERPAPFTPAVPAFKELPMPELVPAPAPEAVTVTTEKPSAKVIIAKVCGALAILAGLGHALLPAGLPDTLLKAAEFVFMGLAGLAG